MPDSFDYTTGTNSENVRLLQALIDDAPEYTEETNSRNANILKSIINNTEYTDAPQSEIEELLLRLKAKIGGEIEVDELNVTENGTYDAGVNKAYNPVTVEIPLDSKTITENGTYTASDDNLAGFNEVTVAVEGYAKKLISNTPTAIATFNASALPMPSLKVGIEATQDLHGYDNPWPAGGGKNKFNTHAYTGIGYNTSTGTTVTLTDSTIPVTVNKNVMTYTVASWEGVAFRTPNLPSGDFHVHCETSSTVNRISVYRIGSDNVIKTVENSTASGTTIDVTRATDANDYIVIWIGSNASGNVTVTNSQVESGQSYTTWTPYENKCPISGWSAVNRYRSGKNLFDSSKCIKGGTYYAPNGTQTTDTNIKVAPAFWLNSDTYTISWNINEGYVRVNILNNDKSFKERVITSNEGRATLNLTNGGFVQFAIDYSITNIQCEIGTTATTFEPYNPNSTTYTTQLKDGQDNPMTCYGGTLSNVNGGQSLTLTHGYIASYNGETLPSTWISDRDVYAEGTTPTTGAEVVYTLATTQTIPQDNLAIATQDGTNNIWADTGDVLEGSYFKSLN